MRMGTGRGVIKHTPTEIEYWEASRWLARTWCTARYERRLAIPRAQKYPDKTLKSKGDMGSWFPWKTTSTHLWVMMERNDARTIAICFESILASRPIQWSSVRSWQRIARAQFKAARPHTGDSSPTMLLSRVRIEGWATHITLCSQYLRIRARNGIAR